VGFLTTASSKKMFLDDSNNDRQPEMAAETGNIYISETMWDKLEFQVPTTNLGFTTIKSWKKRGQVTATATDNRK